MAFDNALALEKIKRELWRIGFPVLKLSHQEPTKMTGTVNYDEHTAVY